MDWSAHFPQYFDPPSNGSVGSVAKSNKRVEWVDIGCGYGGLISALAPMYPEVLMMGEARSTTVMRGKLSDLQVWKSDYK